MSQLMGALSELMGGDQVKQMSRQIGADESSTQTAIAAALPLLLGALAKNAQTDEGAQSLHGALARDHDGGVLGNLGGLFGNPEASPGAGILRHVLGQKQPAAEQAVARTSGLDPATVSRLLVMLAPVVMGVLGRTQRQRGLDTHGLSNLLGGERQQLAQESPDLMGLATRLLDRDGDGSITDELGGLAGKLFGR
jgi:hypothetical protein